MKTDPHSNGLAQYPLAQLGVAMSVGICAGHYLTVPLSFLIFFGAVLTLITLLAVFRARMKIAGACLLVTFFLCGGMLTVLEHWAETSGSFKRLLLDHGINADDPVELTGVLDGPAQFASGRVYFTLRVESVLIKGDEVKAAGVVSLLGIFRTATAEAEYRALSLRYGTRLRVKTSLKSIDKYRNPGVGTLSEYLDRKGYDASGVIKRAGSITRVGDANVFRPLAWIYDWRERLQHEIDSRFPAETAGVLDAALLGNRHNLSHATAERFRAGGTFHVLVISGLHISFIGGLVLVGVRRLTKSSLLRFSLPITVVWAYSLAVGAEASVVRAAFMFTFVALAMLVFRSASSLNSLGAAALALLVHRPTELFDPSFQLTFLSVLAIVVIAWPMLQTLSAIGEWRPTRGSPYPPRCSRWLKTISEVLYWSERSWKKELAHATHNYRLFKSPLAVLLDRSYLQRVVRYTFVVTVVTLSVQLLLLPFFIIYFHRISPASFLLNIVVSVLLTLLVAVALIALVLSQISAALALPFFTLTNTINWLMVHSVDPFVRLGIASFRLPEYSGWASLIYVLYYLPLLWLVLTLFKWRPLSNPEAMGPKSNNRVLVAVSLQFVLVIVLLTHPGSAGTADGRLRIDFLDVDQGDASLITMPNGTTLLIDGGGRPTFANRDVVTVGFERDTRSIGEAVVSEYFWWRGLDSVDYVLATHADADHIDGLNDVVRNFSVRSALVARTPANDPGFAKFAATLSAKGTPLEIVTAGDTLRFGTVEVQVLWPRQSAVETSGNNESVVLRIEFGERSVLLTGDIEKQTEAALVGSNRELQVDIVKVPHHGSRTSSTEIFVRATNPRFAIISAGQNSMFGHPHQEVVERWQAVGARVLTTGRSGTISVSTDGKDWVVKQFVE